MVLLRASKSHQQSICQTETADSHVELARVAAAHAPRSDAWLNTLHIQQIGTRLGNDTFRVGLGVALCHAMSMSTLSGVIDCSGPTELQ